MVLLVQLVPQVLLLHLVQLVHLVLSVLPVLYVARALVSFLIRGPLVLSIVTASGKLPHLVIRGEIPEPSTSRGEAPSLAAIHWCLGKAFATCRAAR